MNHSITELQVLEGYSGDHPVQSPAELGSLHLHRKAASQVDEKHCTILAEFLTLGLNNISIGK